MGFETAGQLTPPRGVYLNCLVLGAVDEQILVCILFFFGWTRTRLCASSPGGPDERRTDAFQMDCTIRGLPRMRQHTDTLGPIAASNSSQGPLGKIQSYLLPIPYLLELVIP